MIRTTQIVAVLKLQNNYQIGITVNIQTHPMGWIIICQFLSLWKKVEFWHFI